MDSFVDVTSASSQSHKQINHARNLIKNPIPDILWQPAELEIFCVCTSKREFPENIRFLSSEEVFYSAFNSDFELPANRNCIISQNFGRSAG